MALVDPEGKFLVLLKRDDFTLVRHATGTPFHSLQAN
jgi:hypothetical protein